MKGFEFTDVPLQVMVDPNGRAVVAKKDSKSKKPEIIAVMGGDQGNMGSLADALLFAEARNMFNLLKRVVAGPVPTEEIIKSMERATGVKIETEER